jgi:hypothetical protein
VNIGGTNGRKERSPRRQSVALETTLADLRSWPFTLPDTFRQFATEPPIWHNIDHAALMQRSPMLAGRMAGKSTEGIEALVRKILDVLD